MSIESIKSRIEGEAKAYAKERKDEAEAKKKEILADAQIKADRIKEDAKERADKETKLLAERRESVAGLESRKMVLEAKQELISESFDKALDKLVNLEEGEYIKFLENQLKPFETEGGEVLLNAEDMKKYGDKLAKLLKGKLVLGKETANIRGGFILKQGDISINCSLEKLLDDKREAMLGDIAAKLFPAK